MAKKIEAIRSYLLATPHPTRAEVARLARVLMVPEILVQAIIVEEANR